MKEVAERIKLLRESVNLSQAKLAVLAGATQSSINRYENDQSTPPLPLLVWYADYFDVSLDYIFGRTGKPEGRLYDYKPKFSEENQQLRQFVEMCFDPKSPMNDKLKQALMEMVSEGGDNA